MIVESNPNTYGLADIGGKDVDHIAWYDVGRGPVSVKEQMDVVADDGTIYRWSRLTDGDPWTFEQRVAPDGSPDPASRQLPAKVGELVERSDEVLYA